MPMQGPQADSSIRTPAVEQVDVGAGRVIWSRIWREPGVAVVEMSSGDAAPRSTAPTTARSSYEELTEEPTQTCGSGVPTSSSTGTTLPGLEGFATSGSSAARSMCSSSSKSPRNRRPPSGRSRRSAPALEPGLRLVVGREDRARRAELGNSSRSSRARQGEVENPAR